MKVSDNSFPSLLLTEGAEPTAPAAGKQRLYIDSTTHKVKITDSSGADYILGPVTTCRKTVDEALSSVSYANSTSMSLALLASKNYAFRFVVFYTTNATSVGIKLAIKGPASCTGYAGTIGGFTAGSTSAAASMIANTQASADISTDLPLMEPATGPGTTATVVIIEGVLVNSTNAGNLLLRHASETATATTILANSYGELTEIA